LEELIENYGLAQLMDEVKNDERLSVKEEKALTRRGLIGSLGGWAEVTKIEEGTS